MATSESNGSKLLEESGSVKVIDRLDKILMPRFVKLMVDGDLSQLIESGSPDKEVLEAAKLKIVSESQEVCPNPISKEHLNLSKKIEAIRTKIVRVSCIIESLRNAYSLTLIEELRIEKYNYPYTEESLQANLDKVEESLKGDLHRLAKLQVEYKALDGRKGSNKKQTLADYIRAIDQYNSAFNTKYSLYDDNFYAIVYFSRMNDLREHYQALNSKD